MQDVDEAALLAATESPLALLDEMPITRVFQGLLKEAHRSTDRNWTKRASDEFDFFYVAAAADLFDVVTVDRSTSALVDKLPSAWFRGQVTTDLSKAVAL